MATDLISKDSESARLNETAQSFLADLDEERKELENLGRQFPCISLIIDEAIDRMFATGRIPGKEFYADVFKQKPFKLTQRVFVPVKQFPKFNFTGKILGPKGNSLRRLQEETQCKIAIKGRNSMRDRQKEEEFRNSDDPRYNHLNKDLFVEISTVASPAESYARVAYALAELRKYLVPDKNDDISHQQLRELMEIDPQSAKKYTNSAARSVFEKKFNDYSNQKYLTLLKQTTHSHDEESHHYSPKLEEEIYDYQPRGVKRAATSEYTHSRTIPSAPSQYKRPTAYPSSDTRRVHEPTNVKMYKSNSYGLINKYR